MGKSILAISLIAVLLIGVISFDDAFAKEHKESKPPKEPKLKNNDIVAMFAALWDAITGLQDQIDNLVTGTQGPPGDDGISALIETRPSPVGCDGEPGTVYVFGLDLDGDGMIGNLRNDPEFVAAELVCDGADGSDGQDGTDGSAGINGVNGADGEDGADGQDGTSTIFSFSNGLDTYTAGTFGVLGHGGLTGGVTDLVPFDGIMKNLYVATAFGAPGGSVTITLQKGPFGSNQVFTTQLSCTVTDAETSCTDFDDVPMTAGEHFRLLIQGDVRVTRILAAMEYSAP